MKNLDMAKNPYDNMDIGYDTDTMVDQSTNQESEYKLIDTEWTINLMNTIMYAGHPRGYILSGFLKRFAIKLTSACNKHIFAKKYIHPRIFSYHKFAWDSMIDLVNKLSEGDKLLLFCKYGLQLQTWKLVRVAFLKDHHNPFMIPEDEYDLNKFDDPYPHGYSHYKKYMRDHITSIIDKLITMSDELTREE